jgi:hypothetical protein
MERRAALEGMTKAQFLETAVRHYLGELPRLPLRRQFAAVLEEVLVCKAFSHSVARELLGEESVDQCLPAVEQSARLRVHSLLNRLDEVEEG